MKTYWLSFADDSGFLGGCVVDAGTDVLAVVKAHGLGINPGGEVKVVDLGDTEVPFKKDLLYSKSDIEAMDGGAAAF